MTSDHELGFLRGMAEKLGYYVYALMDPRDHRVFYVGKGKGDRVFQHAATALVVPGESSRTSKLGTIRKIQTAGLSVDVQILRHGLDESTAFEVEAGIIDALRAVGRIDLTNKARGMDSVARGWTPLTELRAEYAAKRVPIEHRVMLVKINQNYRTGMTEAQLYKATREWWKLDPERRPEYAFAVYNGVVRAVYKIDQKRWAQDPETGRWQFAGKLDPELNERYKWSDVSDYASQNPIRYVNCGRRLAERRAEALTHG